MKSIAIGSADLAASIRPDLGGCIEALHFKGQAVLRSSERGNLSHVRLSACYPLVPFSNRIAHARLVWQGTSHPLVKNFADEEHMIHGIGWQRAWEVLDVSEDRCMLSLEHSGDSTWPFAFDASQVIHIRGHVLECTLSITNQSNRPAPVGLGWHPYLVKRAGAQLSFSAQGIWQMGADKLPTERVRSGGIDASCDSLSVDNCFDGWAGVATLRDAVHTVRVESSLRYLVAFTHPSKDFVAIEPVSHVNNAMNARNPNELGVLTLEAGQSWQASMHITVEPT
jgi:aldose 1-epimerase